MAIALFDVIPFPPLPAIAPYEPTGVKAEALSSTKIRVSWEPSIPRLETSPVVAYSIAYFPTNGKAIMK